MSYVTNGDDYISPELETHIRLLHRAVGNAVTDGKFIVFGSGSTQLFNALIYALASADDDECCNDSSSPALVVATAPYYPAYKIQTIMFDGRKYEWRGLTTSAWVQNYSHYAQNNSRLIEFVTSPNNPDGELKESVVRGARLIHDHAYYWPHYTAIAAPADEDIMLFTVSKLSGHAGSRFGWALIKDEKVYERVLNYIGLNTSGVSRDTQLRMLKVLRVITGGVDGDDIFEFGYEKMRERWRNLQAVVSESSDRFSLQNLSPQYCSYFNKTRDPSPAYGWLKCQREEEEDCSAVLKRAGILSRTGTMFEADARYTRLSLLKTDDDMDLLLKRFRALIDESTDESIKPEEEEGEADADYAATVKLFKLSR